MQLITMAHMGEAQSVIESFKLNKIRPDLFKNEEIVLVITGEGPFEAATKTALVLGEFKFTNVINLGIAGTLDSSLEIGSIHPVRTIYLLQELKPQFKSFKAFDKGLDCLTSFERILHPEKAQKLKGLGALIDREAWGVAMAAKTAGVPFESYKLISDLAGTIDACELVREDALAYSHKLSEFLQTHLPKTKPLAEVFSIPGFYFTFSTEHKFQTLLKKLSIKEDKTTNDILDSLPLSELLQKKTSPKQKSLELLKIMEDRVDPIRKNLEDKKSLWLKDFEKNGIKVHTDPLWENETVTVTIEISSEEELTRKALALQSLSLKPFHDLMNGEL